MRSKSLIVAFIFTWLTLLALLVFADFATAQSHTFTLNWQDNNPNETGTKIERCSGVGCTSFVEVFSLVGANLVQYKDTVSNTGAGKLTYCYRVRAFNSAGMTGYSNTACGVTPEIIPAPTTPPSGLTVGAISASTIELSWKNPDGADDQRITAHRSKPWRTEEIIIPATLASYRDSGLKRANTNCYTLAARFGTTYTADTDMSCGTTRR